MCKEELQVSVKLDWGTTEFDLLGITFSIDLNKIPSLYYDRAILKSKKIYQKLELTIFNPFR